MHRTLSPDPSPLTRLVSLLAAALVMVLVVLAASPDLHERIHGHPLPVSAGHASKAAAAEDDEGCVVTLFAQGLVLALGLMALEAFARLLSEDAAPEAILAWADPRYLRLPAQGPPVGVR